MKKLTRKQKGDIRTIAAQRDEDIDFSDIPPVLDWSKAGVGKFYRPEKKGHAEARPYKCQQRGEL